MWAVAAGAGRVRNLGLVRELVGVTPIGGPTLEKA